MNLGLSKRAFNLFVFSRQGGGGGGGQGLLELYQKFICFGSVTRGFVKAGKPTTICSIPSKSYNSVDL